MLNIMKVAVGVSTIEQLKKINKAYALENNGYPYTLTRSPPKQIKNILNGGSLYRVIKGVLCCRQLINDFIPSTRQDGRACIKIILEPEIILTYSVTCKPFQGWRYLKTDQAPQDLETLHNISLPTMPESLKRTLIELRLI
ncbi:hypothetical protein COMNV_00013 [Commensalibacter sp. Nvir]|uniref:DUF1489 family protein n=1 Tax=Commensalibacter sp. Nvir TaxID=3069817 RepID=UPI002D5F58CB|nr:hypothetical protein COMNV_00013 [Commensalibacter sp. Nvir]